MSLTIIFNTTESEAAEFQNNIKGQFFGQTDFDSSHTAGSLPSVFDALPPDDPVDASKFSFGTSGNQFGAGGGNMDVIYNQFGGDGSQMGSNNNNQFGSGIGQQGTNNNQFGSSNNKNFEAADKQFEANNNNNFGTNNSNNFGSSKPTSSTRDRFNEIFNAQAKNRQNESSAPSSSRRPVQPTTRRPVQTATRTSAPRRPVQATTNEPRLPKIFSNNPRIDPFTDSPPTQVIFKNVSLERSKS